MKEYQTLSHCFSPVFDEHSKILILGTFPSVKSREINFYYGHPQNRFWRVLAALQKVPVPQSIDLQVIENFAKSNPVSLTISEQSEHSFMGDGDDEVIKNWLCDNL